MFQEIGTEIMELKIQSLFMVQESDYAIMY